MLRRTLSLSRGMAYCCLTPFSCLRELYITHKSTYGQRYLPSPPDPLSRTAGEGLNGDVVCDFATRNRIQAL